MDSTPTVQSIMTVIQPGYSYTFLGPFFYFFFVNENKNELFNTKDQTKKFNGHKMDHKFQKRKI